MMQLLQTARRRARYQATNQSPGTRAVLALIGTQLSLTRTHRVRVPSRAEIVVVVVAVSVRLRGRGRVGAVV